MKKQRKHYTPEEKVAILRRHLLDKEPISTLRDELGLQPTVFYRWQKEFFENGARLPSSRKHGRTTPPSWSESPTWRRRSRRKTRECIWPGTPLSLEDAQRLAQGYVEHYNNVRLNSAIGYITPKDMLAGRQQVIHAERDRKLEEARKRRQIWRQQAA